MLNQVSRTQLLRHSAIAGLAMIVWLLLVPRLPIMGQMPGVAILSALVVIALTVDHRPAMIAVAIGAIGFEMLRAAPTVQVHIVRAVVFALMGGALVALVYARTIRTRGALQYRTLFERHPLPMWVYDADSLAFLAVNQAAVRTYGFTEGEFARMTVKDVRLADDPPRPEAPSQGGQEETGEAWRHLTKSGQLLEVFVRSQAVALQGRRARLALIEDVTERRSIEEQLRQAQKMEAIGRLAGGIAHDFNNLLTAIRGYAALLLDSLPTDDPRHDDAAEIDRAGERAAALTRQLLAFSRKQLLHVRVVSMTSCLEDMLPMLPRVLGETIELRTIMRAEARIRCDPSQLQQVLMNLVVNARDALVDGGRITIETEDVVLDTHYTSHHATVQPGPHAVLIVSDNGCGMDAATQSRVFEPFFTTKPVGEGTGLGLATVYGIVKQSGGHVWLYSELDHGTTFKIYFPTTDAPEDVVDPSVPSDARRRGRGTILVVEDEHGVRSLMTRLLERKGYTVLAAATPSAARDIWDRPGATIDLLITDLVLPGMSGRLVANEMRLRHPDTPVLFISGYTKDGVVTNGVLHEDANFLAKPFAADELLRRVAAALSDVSA